MGQRYELKSQEWEDGSLVICCCVTNHPNLVVCNDIVIKLIDSGARNLDRAPREWFISSAP